MDIKKLNEALKRVFNESQQYKLVTITGQGIEGWFGSED